MTCAWCGGPLELVVVAAGDGDTPYCCDDCATDAVADPGYYDRMVDENEGVD